METKPLSVTKDVYLDFMINKVVDAIVTRWPRGHEPKTTVRIQQDGPPVHNIFNKPSWIKAVTTHHHYEIELFNQPAQSPDTNLNDLGFFASLQANTWKLKRANGIDGLIANVEEAYTKYEPVVLNRIWLTHMGVCNQILEHEGGNHFSLPHMQKEVLERRGELPSQIELSEAAKAKVQQLQLRD